MKKQKNIQYFAAKAISFGLLMLLNLFPAEQANAENLIICGGGTNRKCDLDTRQCVKYKETKFIVGCKWPAECSYEVDVYKCIGKNETKPKEATNVTVSTNASGQVLTGKDEQTALDQSKESDYTAFEIQENVNAYYKEHPALTVSQKAKDILAKAEGNEKDKEGGFGSFLNEDDVKGLRSDMEELARFTGKEGYDDGMSSPGDSKMQDKFQAALEHLKDIHEEGYITDAEYDILNKELESLIDEAQKRAKEAAIINKDAKKVEQIQEEIAEVQEEIAASYEIYCPTSDQLRARYHAGCWACLVLEKLTSAFLHAANHGLKVVQRAGLTLLWLGTAIWIVFWGLKNVSSFTEIQLGNILNDLIKFLFKVAVAYWFIVYSPTAISKYFITPMMSIGAVVGQEFWSQDIQEYTDAWDSMTEEDQKEQQKEVDALPELQSTPTPQKEDIPVAAESKMTEEDIQEDNQSNSKNEANFTKKKIPNLLIPGTKDGCLSSPFGCRPRPCTGCSKCHKGVDVGLNCTGKREAARVGCVPVLAAGPGVIEYKRPDGKGNGAGHTAYINHGNIGGHNWKTSYFHMKPYNEKFKSGARVRQGDTIGCIGSTGVGTAIHLHFQVFVDEKVVDPLALPMGHIVYLDCNTCTGTNRTHFKPTVYAANKRVGEGFPAAGEAIESLNSAAVSAENSGGAGTDGAIETNYDSLIVEIPEVKYTGPTNIMPKSIMNSILGATRAITDTTADVMVIGDMIMCYSQEENGGAWRINADWLPDKLKYWTNWVMWIQGGIIWCLGFMLTVSIAYYLIDISFKIGFAVLAIPVMMGLWPFGFTQSKIFVALSIIAKSSATFAFLALTTAFGMGLVSSSVDGLEDLYDVMDGISQGEDVEEIRKNHVRDTLYLFSPAFVLLVFSILYFYKLVQQTISDLVNKFFPDQAFGDSSPMHSGATMATSFAKRFAMSASGFNLARDVVAHQAGNLAKGCLKRTGQAIRHPVKSAKAIGRGIKNAAGAITGKKSSGGK